MSERDEDKLLFCQFKKGVANKLITYFCNIDKDILILHQLLH